jgi:hypothetical protein
MRAAETLANFEAAASARASTGDSCSSVSLSG